MDINSITPQSNYPTICLNMIVKNEAHLISETLKMLCSKIKFTYWVICDTGSTDNTKEQIIEFFKQQNIGTISRIYTGNVIR